MPLTNKQYERLMTAYAEKRAKAAYYQEEKIKEIYEAQPLLTALDDELSAYRRELIKKKASGAENVSEESRKFFEEASVRREKLLKEKGYSLSDLEPRFECEFCKDTGYLENRKRCRCLIQATIDINYAQSNIKKVLEEENFDNFRTDIYSEETIDSLTKMSAKKLAEKALKDAKSFIENFDSDFSNLLLFGEPGVGKTYLTNCITKELIESGHSAIYLSAHGLFDILEKSKFSKDEESEELKDEIFECDLLIVDDLGTEMPNNFTISQFFLCINERLLRKKSTIISTNLSLNNIMDIYSERTFSRISGYYKLIRLSGDDLRIKLKNKKN